MCPLIPFAISLVGAIFSDQREGSSTDTTYGFTPIASAKPVTQIVAPTRFTKGTALANIAAAKGSVEKKVLEPSSEEPEEDDEAEEEEEQVDPEEAAHNLIDQEFMIEAIASSVAEDMDMGWDEDLEESLPSDEEYFASKKAKKADKYGSSYYSARAVSPQRIDRIADSINIFGGNDTDIFVPGSRWGIKRRKS